MSGSLASFDNYSSGASESIQKLVYNEHRGRKSQKRSFEKKEERKNRYKEKREQEKEEELSYLSKYRDRAKEVRELGYDKDYEGLRPEDFEGLTEEELQLLGGDASHAHLVKGIDTILLQRKRDEIAKEAERKQIEEEQRNLRILETRHFNTEMASNMYSVLFSNREALNDITATTSKREFFSKGRNTYKMITSGETDSILFDSPSIIVHSKHDCPDSSKQILYIPPQSMIGQIAESFSKIGLGQNKKNRKRKEKKAIKAVDEELDMFADYECFIQQIKLHRIGFSK